MELKYTLDERLEHARQLRAQGYNCAQCVVMAFDDVIDGDLPTLGRAAHGFGSGIGASGDVCGAISGTTMVLGLVHHDQPRPQLYSRVREAKADFTDLEGGCDCRELKREGRKPCLELITDAVALLHKRLEDA